MKTLSHYGLHAGSPVAVALLLAAAPYVALRVYLSGVMHAAEAEAAAPSAMFLATLVVVGVVAPAVFLAHTVRRLLRDRETFELRALLEVYFALVVVFAVGYAVLQAGAAEAAFEGMPVVWDAIPASDAAHVSRHHAVFGNALYLSVVTMTTVGYGDLVPISWAAKALTGAQGLIGIGFVGLVLGQYFSSCIACSPQGR